MAEEDWDKANPWILNKMIDLSERMLDSHESANLVIIFCVILSVLAAIALGVVLTQAAAPVHQMQILN